MYVCTYMRTYIYIGAARTDVRERLVCMYAQTYICAYVLRYIHTCTYTGAARTNVLERLACDWQPQIDEEEQSGADDTIKRIALGRANSGLLAENSREELYRNKQ